MVQVSYRVVLIAELNNTNNPLHLWLPTYHIVLGEGEICQV